MALLRNSSLVFPALVVAVAFSSGCSGVPGEGLGTSQQAASTPFANDKTAYDYFIGKGLTNFQAAAVVGNLDQESGIDPEIHQAGGGVGRGIAQWSAGARWDTTPNDNVVAFAAQKGQSATSLTLQLDFIWYELTTFSDYGLAELKATSNVTDATQVFEDKFEGCVYANYPECALPSRVNFAKGVLAAYGADTGQGGQGNGGGGGQAGASAGGSGGTGGSSGGAGAGGSGGAGTSGAGAGGTPVATGGTATAGTTSAGGGSTGGGGTSSAGAPTGAGGGGSAGTAPTAGTTSGGAGLPFLNSTSSDDSSCSFAPPSSGGVSVWASWLGVLAVLGLRRRATKPRP
ncbi:MAG TPA: phage tail tip lysozyme [Polyangiaceae bacterium]|nr:phage tail tip lysozyme [Polyangiaceae bacterium]